jgi:predicted Holliday junction resolvase-like endonuclease
MTDEVRQSLLKSISSDRRIIVQAPCQHIYRLSDSIIFPGGEMPEPAKNYVGARKEEIAGLNEELSDLKKKLTTGFETKSIDVTIGKVMEKVVPALASFPYQPRDCRPLFEPIDYIAFIGLSGGAVNGIDFFEIKTGEARLSGVQKQIKAAVEDGDVRIERCGDG